MQDFSMDYNSLDFQQKKKKKKEKSKKEKTEEKESYIIAKRVDVTCNRLTLMDVEV